MAMPLKQIKPKPQIRDKYSILVDSMAEKLDKVIAKAPALECKDGKVILDHENPAHRRWYGESEEDND